MLHGPEGCAVVSLNQSHRGTKLSPASSKEQTGCLSLLLYPEVAVFAPDEARGATSRDLGWLLPGSASENIQMPAASIRSTHMNVLHATGRGVEEALKSSPVCFGAEGKDAAPIVMDYKQPSFTGHNQINSGVTAHKAYPLAVFVGDRRLHQRGHNIR